MLCFQVLARLQSMMVFLCISRIVYVFFDVGQSGHIRHAFCDPEYQV